MFAWLGGIFTGGAIFEALSGSAAGMVLVGWLMAIGAIEFFWFPFQMIIGEAKIGTLHNFIPQTTIWFGVFTILIVVLSISIKREIWPLAGTAFIVLFVMAVAAPFIYIQRNKVFSSDKAAAKTMSVTPPCASLEGKTVYKQGLGSSGETLYDCYLGKGIVVNGEVLTCFNDNPNNVPYYVFWDNRSNTVVYGAENDVWKVASSREGKDDLWYHHCTSKTSQ